MKLPAHLVTILCLTLIAFASKLAPAATFNIANGDVAALKAAINTANTNNQQNIINLAANGAYVLYGADDGINGLPPIQGTAHNFPFTIHGNGSVILRNPDLSTAQFRLMKIDCPNGSSVQVYIDNLTLVAGSIASSVDQGFGGAIYNNGGSLTLSFCTLSGHQAAAGGAIWSSGPLSISDSYIHDNFATGQAGGVIASAVTFLRSKFSANSAATTGGGILVTSGAITDCTISGNSAAEGAGIYVYNTTGSIPLTISTSTVSGNQASANGGGIECNAAFDSEDNTSYRLYILSSTISGNTAAANGGALVVRVGGVAIEHSTVTQNYAAKGRGIFVYVLEPIGPFDFSFVKLATTILSGDGVSEFDADDSQGSNGNTQPEVLQSGDFNLLGPLILESTRFVLQAHDQVAVTDPKLGPLQDNGGPTFTHLPIVGSPVLDAGRAGSVFGVVPATDQRGDARTYDQPDEPNVSDGTDIGAVEAGDYGESLIVTTTADEDNGTSNPHFGTGTSLREAINYASALPHDGSQRVITFSLPHGSVIQLNSDLPKPFAILDIDGGPDPTAITIKGTPGMDRIFDSPYTLNGLTLSTGQTGLYANGATVITHCIFTGFTGSAVHVKDEAYPVIIISDCTFRDNRGTSSGGAVFLDSNESEADFNDCVFIGNSAQNGGAVFSRQTPAVFSRCVFAQNSAAAAGGAIYSDQYDVNVPANLILRETTITGNSAGTSGGGINAFTFADLESCTLDHNTAPSGGGINTASFATFVNSTVSDNTATTRGGGINGNGFILVSSTVTANTAPAASGSGIYTSQGSAYGNSVISGNSAGGLDIAFDPKAAAEDDGFNLIGLTNQPTFFTAASDIVGVLAPGLGALQDNGGPTATRAPLAGSPALDHGKNLGHGAYFTPPTLDQRGYARTFDLPTYLNAVGGDATDIGAVEVGQLQLIRAVSRLTHGSAGAFDVDLPLTGAPGVECRRGNGAFMLVFKFTNNLFSGTATVTKGSGSVSGVPTISGNTMTIKLAGVTDAQRLTVTVTNIIDAYGQTLASTAVSMTVLLGDVTGDGRVDSGDLTVVRNLSVSIPKDATRARADVNCSGRIDSGDGTIVRGASVTAVPSK